MGTLTGTNIADRVGFVLNDANVRWTTAELLLWINDAMREIAVVQPEASAVITNINLVAGTKQTLPAGAIALGRVTRNMGVGGATPADAPRQTTQALMDLYKPAWHTDTSALAVKNWMKDSRTPRVFYVYPPMTSATIVEAEYSVIPTPLAAIGNAIPLDDFYVNPIVDYALWRAFSKDAELPNMMERAASHRGSFERTIGLTDAGEEKQA